jgi:heme a synthase
MTSSEAETVQSKPKAKRMTHASVRTWLMWVAFLVFVMVAIGGLTRLTDSGLSITEWQPLLGAWPPMNEADWQLAFDKYKQTTEFKVQNNWMQLSDFKPIFWWEWGHRNFGRLIGVAYLVPLLYFLVRGRIAWRLLPALVLLFVLGGLQGALGWYMVKSGLTDRTDVSHYRLAAHLVAASILFASILWVAFGIGWKRGRFWSSNSLFAGLLLLLIFVQMTAGALMAGMDAGHASYTWPKMDGVWIPDGLTTLQPLWKNALENALAVHFNHRALGYGILLLVCLHAWHAFNVSSWILAYAVFTQIALGALLVLLKLPIALASAHQMMALAVVAAAVWNLHRQAATEYVGTSAAAPAANVPTQVTPKLAPNLQ